MRADDRGKHLRIAILGMISITVVAMFGTLDVRVPWLVYNASASAPIGLYRVEQRLPRRGEMALVEPPPLVELMLYERGLLPRSVPLVKQVAAVGGDEVCRRKGEGQDEIAINGQVVAEALEKDTDGRPLPKWEGCLHLATGEFFLLQPHPRSFDSRYFGPVLRCDVLGVVRRVWASSTP